MIQELSIDPLFGFKVEEGGKQEVYTKKETDILENIERARIIQYEDVIKVQIEVDIDIDNYNLPELENLPVAYEQE